MARELASLAMALLVGACSPNAAGGGSGSGALPSNGGTESSEGSGHVATGDEGSTDADGGTGTGTTGDAGPSPDEGPAAHPEVTISHGPVLDFGPHDLASGADRALTVTNEGYADATAVQVTEVDGVFSITDHDCPQTLVPGGSCQVQVRFEPERFGDVEAELEVVYQDQGMATSVSRPLVGRGVGVTGNLLVNGGGEEGNATDSPPMGWTIAYGPSWSASWDEVTPVGGDRTISAGWGPPGMDQFTLLQQIGAASITTWGDVEGVRFHYRAHHRSESTGNDPTWVVLRFRSNDGTELEAHPSGSFSGIEWNVSVGDASAPAGAHRVEFVLECTRVYNDWCSGFYDDLELWAEWSG